MDNRKIIERYIPLVEFISAVLGDNAEVVLHDLTCPENSIIAIKNEHLSGRLVGGPLTDLVLKVIQDKSYKDKDFIANYKAAGKNKSFRSSSFFIKDEKEEIIGVLCVNIDIEPFEKVKEIMDKLTSVTQSFENSRIKENVHVKEIKIEEQLHTNVEALLITMVEDVIGCIGISPQRMSIEEKMNVVKDLDNRGAFQLKGAVSEVSKALEVSEPTVYRYLNKIKD